MRWIFMLLLFPLSLMRAQVIDDFSDGDFTANPQWVGSTDLFRIDPSTGMLQLYAPAVEGEAALFTTSVSMEDAVWQFRFRMGFNPSSANYARVYLAAQDVDDLNTGDAFYLVMGTTADNISLWEQKGGVNRKLIDGRAGRLNLSNVDGQVRVSRRKGGLLILEYNPGNGWVEEGRYDGSVGISSSWFGVSCCYTSTRSKLFYFDDFVVTGEAFKDTIPPEVTQFEVVNRYKFHLLFSKPVDRLHLNPDCFILEPGGSIPVISQVEDNIYAVELLYRQGISLYAGAALTIAGLEDMEGNVMANTTFEYSYTPVSILSAEVTDSRNLSLCFSGPLNLADLSASCFSWEGSGPEIVAFSEMESDCVGLSLLTDYPNGQPLSLILNKVVALNGDTIDAGPYPLFYYQAARNDIVITEVMADPSPSVLLPASEYIELYNRGEFPVNLKDYQLSVGNTKVFLSEYLLFPNDYLLLVPAGSETDWPDIPGLLVVSGWPTLTNGQGQIVLCNKEGKVITALKYHQSMGVDGFKQEGGWSLEVIDPDNLSGDYDNWAFSNDEKGGTPGRTNSVAAENPDCKSPELKGAYLKNPSLLVLEFSEPMNPVVLNDISGMMVEPASLQIESILPETVFLSEAEVRFSDEMPQDRLFELTFQELPVDLAGNCLEGPFTCQFGWPVDPLPGQVVINELMFDPPADGQDYLELFNASDHLLDLSEIYVSRANAEGLPEKLVGLSDQIRIFPPKSYRVFSSNKEWILHNWSTEDVASVQLLTDLPNYPLNEGTVFVTNVSGEVFDRFDYNEKMHFALLERTKGVSLERIDHGTPTQESSNWHSAASTSRYGTPGRVNSQAAGVTALEGSDFIRVEPEIFFPNQDGFQDLLFLYYTFSEAGNTCTITVFNREGRAVRHLVNNQTAGREGFFTWDGLDDQGRRAPTGIYLVWAQSFNLKGTVRETRKIAVLGSGKSL